MREDPTDRVAPARRELMSRMVDGDLPSADEACAAWRDDPAAREAWSTYHLIGDALRSDELTSGVTRSEVFLAEFRRRVAGEPVVLAPAAPARRPRILRWGAPAAVAAGLAAVAVTVLVLQEAGPSGSRSPTLAAASGAAPAAGALVPGVTLVANEPRWQAAHRKLIRDEQLDAYLRAHRGAPETLPGTASGRFETVVLDR